jgi:hypothetical protein
MVKFPRVAESFIAPIAKDKAKIEVVSTIKYGEECSEQQKIAITVSNNVCKCSVNNISSWVRTKERSDIEFYR